MKLLQRMFFLFSHTYLFFFFSYQNIDYHLDNVKDNEADLFRRTTLHQCLDQEPRRSRFYPLPEFGGIYCPNQAVFRHGLGRDNEFMDRFEWISVVVS